MDRNAIFQWMMSSRAGATCLRGVEGRGVERAPEVDLASFASNANG